MKNAAAELFYTSEIEAERPNAKVFFQFIGTFESTVSEKQVTINSKIRMTLVKQSPKQDIFKLRPKQKILVLAQIVQQNKHIEGQIRKITLEQALKYENIMKKQQQRQFEKVNMIGSKNQTTDEQDEKKTKTTIFGQRNGGFYQHF